MISDITGVDVHAHGVPRRFLELLRKTPLAGVEVVYSDDKYVVTFPGARSLRPVTGGMLQFADRNEWLDDQLMRNQIVSPWLDIHGQELPESDGQEWVRKLNDAMSEEVGETNGRMYAYATLHLSDTAAAVKELERARHELSMVGAMIPTYLNDAKLTDNRYDALWEAAQSLAMPIVLHPPTIAPSNCLFGEFPESGVHGRAIETTITATQLIMTGVLDRFPNLRFVLVHGGGFLPYQANRIGGEGPLVNIEKGGVEEAKGPRRPVTEYLRSFHYDSVLMSAAALRFLFDVAGLDKVMVGSDFGARPRFTSPPLTAQLAQAGLPQDEEDQVMFKNAYELFQITPK